MDIEIALIPLSDHGLGTFSEANEVTERGTRGKISKIDFVHSKLPETQRPLSSLSQWQTATMEARRPFPSR